MFADPSSDVVGAVAFVGGKVAIAGDITSVKAAVDTGGKSGLAADEGFVAARAAAAGDHIGFFFMDTRALMDAVVSMTEGVDGAPPMSPALLALVPDWTAGRLRVEGDAVVIDSMTPHVDAAPGPSENRANASPVSPRPRPSCWRPATMPAHPSSRRSRCTARTRAWRRSSRASTRRSA